MKRLCCILLALLLVLPAAACSAPTPTVTPVPTLDPGTVAVVFTDSALEAKVRKAMGKAEGTITVGEAEAVTELNLSNEWQSNGIPENLLIKDISSLQPFQNLTQLDLSFNSVSDPSILAGLPKLEVLRLGGNSIADVSSLAGMVGLKELHLWGNNQIKDIAPLSGMVQMGTLFLNGNQISDLRVVANMKMLGFLDISNNQIVDLTPLVGLPITRLKLNGNPITDFSPIQSIYSKLVDKDFELLSADGIPADPLVFADAKFEKALRAAMNILDRPITKKDAFLAQALFIGNDKTEDSAFTDISPLVDFVNLSSLEFNANLIADLSPLSGLVKLKQLAIPFNRVVDLAPLSGLTQLEILDLRFNQIVDVSPLAKLDKLNNLQLRDNPIVDFSPLKDLYVKLKNKDFELE
jgi:internalin A